MARDGGFCDKCGKHHIHSNQDAIDAMCYALEQLHSKGRNPLLTIELQDETSVPKVFYQGEEITGKIRISFDWETKNAQPGSGGTMFNVEYADPNDGEFIVKGIGLARGKYATD